MVRLAALKPSTDEIEEARKRLASLDKKQLRARQGSMAYFMKANPENVEDADKRGDERKKLLELFLVHQFRQKDAKRVVKSQETHGKTKDDVDLVYQWSAAKMRQELGEAKAEAWMSSDKLRWEKDEVTGSED